MRVCSSSCIDITDVGPYRDDVELGRLGMLIEKEPQGNGACSTVFASGVTEAILNTQESPHPKQ